MTSPKVDNTRIGIGVVKWFNISISPPRTGMNPLNDWLFVKGVTPLPIDNRDDVTTIPWKNKERIVCYQP
jgi:hypothetical protein